MVIFQIRSVVLYDLRDVLIDCRVLMYADDVQLYTSTRKENIDSCLHLINRKFYKIDSWAGH